MNFKISKRKKLITKSGFQNKPKTVISESGVQHTPKNGYQLKVASKINQKRITKSGLQNKVKFIITKFVFQNQQKTMITKGDVQSKLQNDYDFKIN